MYYVIAVADPGFDLRGGGLCQRGYKVEVSHF